MGYEQARDELASIVRMLEQGGMNLDASLALWERGEQLAAHCQHYLAGAQQRIEQVVGNGQGDGENGQEDDEEEGAEEARQNSD